MNVLLQVPSDLNTLFPAHRNQRRTGVWLWQGLPGTRYPEHGTSTHPWTIHPLALELHLNPGRRLSPAVVSGVWVCLMLSHPGPAFSLQVWFLAVVTPALLAQVLCDSGGGVCVIALLPPNVFPGRGYESHNKIDWGCCGESEISVWIFGLLLRGSGLCEFLWWLQTGRNMGLSVETGV